MPKGAALSETSSGESISHFAAIRIRVTGYSQRLVPKIVNNLPTAELIPGHVDDVKLQMKVYSLDDVRFKTLVELPLNEKTRIIPTRIVNFMEQRASFELKTIKINERIRVNRIVIFSREIFTSYPGS